MSLANSDIARLRNEKTFQVSTFDLEKKQKTIDVRRGQKVTLADVKGQGTIVQFWMTFPGWFWQHWNPSEPVSQTILKTLILRIWWDGSPHPAVEAPVGDFFGMGLGHIASFASQYFGMSSGGFFCKFPMPFRSGFRIELENLDPHVDTVVFANLLYQQSETPPGADLGWFHTQFHTGRKQGPEPLDILEAHGKGHYVGCALATQGEERNYLSFLEAPEYIWIDEDWQTPRITGTGLEDYFLGGWYFREGPFIGPLHGVPVKDTFNASVAMYRIHDRDAVNFENRIRFQFINPWQPERLKPYAYAALAYYYLDSPEGSTPPVASAEDVLIWYRTSPTDHSSIP